MDKNTNNQKLIIEGVRTTGLKAVKPAMYMLLGGILVLAFIGGKTLIADQNKEADRVTAITPTLLPTAVPTITPEPTPEPTIILKKTVNPELQKRITEIDNQIAQLKETIKQDEELLPQATQQDIMSDLKCKLEGICGSLGSISKIIQARIDQNMNTITQLNAEKTQIMLKM